MVVDVVEVHWCLVSVLKPNNSVVKSIQKLSRKNLE